jgi:hypothetical protein
VLLAAGCNKKQAEADTAEVSGQVFYKGQPLPGGDVIFSAKGGLTVPAPIDENGNYKIKAPVGDVRLAVDNRRLQEVRGAREGPRLKRPGAEKPTDTKGTYVEIPPKYYSVEESGLTYTVKNESQTHDIKLE